MKFKFCEFFAGAGMARVGLGTSWHCQLANDFDPLKARAYKKNWSEQDFIFSDVAEIKAHKVSDHIDLVWSSFPCQDLSLAGNGVGLGTNVQNEMTRSGSFWPFWKIIREKVNAGSGPKIICLENVYGLITSNQGSDFRVLSEAFAEINYKFGFLIIDAKHFVPQSRPRVFVVGVAQDIDVPRNLLSYAPKKIWHGGSLVEKQKSLSAKAAANWTWWNLPEPTREVPKLIDLASDIVPASLVNGNEKTKYLISLMDQKNKLKLRNAMGSGSKNIGCLYRRTRKIDGRSVQRAEIRFDNVSGCLRTPSGGSSKQTFIIVNQGKVETRFPTKQELKSLMGLPSDFWLPDNYTETYKIIGDGLVTNVVRHLSENIFEPILEHNALSSKTRQVG
jgi:DNA (cytosine-5)-methyltransferase 1